MKKKAMITSQLFFLFVAFALFVYFFVSPVARADHENGKPFEEIWAAIRNLQDQINNIELVPGPPGSPGPEGPQGPAGPAGGGESGISKDTVYRTDVFRDVGPGPAVELNAYCTDDNDVIISGGFWTSHADIRVLANYPNPHHAIANWSVWAHSVGAPGMAQAVAECLTVE